MKEKNTKFLTYCITAALLLFLLLCGYLLLQVLFAAIQNNDEEIAFDQDWRYSIEGQWHTLGQLPVSVLLAPEEKLVISHILPDHIDQGFTLYIKTNYQQVSGRVDGQSLSGNNTIGLFDWNCAAPWTILQIPESQAGQKLILTLSNNGSRNAIEIEQIYLAAANAINYVLLRQSLGTLATATLLLLTTVYIISLLAFLCRRYQSQNFSRFGNLALFLLLSTIWILSHGDLQGLLAMTTDSYLPIHLFAYLLLPLPLLWAIRGFATKGKWALELLAALFLLHGGIAIFRVFTGSFSLAFTLLCNHLLLALTVIVVLAIYIINLRLQKDWADTITFFCSLLLTILLFLQTILCYLGPSARNSHLFSYGLLLLILLLSIYVSYKALSLFKRSQSFEQLSQNIPGGICCLKSKDTPTLTIQFANDYCYAMFGYTRQEALALGFDSLDFLMRQANSQEFRRTLNQARREGKRQIETELKLTAKDGNLIWILLRGQLEPDGSITAMLMDITDRQKAYEQLRINEEEYRIAVSHSGKMIHRYDIPGKTLYLSPQSAELFGLELIMRDAPESIIAAGSVAKESINDYRQFFDAMALGQNSGETAILRKIKGGRRVWHHASYTLIRDQEDRPASAVISFEDITQLREKELAYEKWRQNYEALPEQTINYYEYNLTDDIFEREEGSMLPRVPAEVPRTLSAIAQYTADNYAYPADRQRFLNFYDRNRLLDCYNRGIRGDKMECRRLGSKGEPLWTQASVQLIPDPYSADIKSFILLEDIHEQKQAELLLEARSRQDALTGLLNRRVFEEQFTALLQTNPQAHHGLILMDIDNFKQVNDSLGHQAGDAVLLGIANKLKFALRSDDLCGRLGGDEFIMVLKNIHDEQALAQKLSYLCRLVQDQRGDVAISGSFGLACHPGDGKNFAQLYRCADMALYQAKAKGRGCFVRYQSWMQTEDWQPQDNTPID